MATSGARTQSQTCNLRPVTGSKAATQLATFPAPKREERGDTTIVVFEGGSKHDEECDPVRRRQQMAAQFWIADGVAMHVAEDAGGAGKRRSRKMRGVA